MLKQCRPLCNRGAQLYSWNGHRSVGYPVLTGKCSSKAQAGGIRSSVPLWSGTCGDLCHLTITMASSQTWSNVEIWWNMVFDIYTSWLKLYRVPIRLLILRLDSILSQRRHWCESPYTVARCSMMFDASQTSMFRHPALLMRFSEDSGQRAFHHRTSAHQALSPNAKGGAKFLGTALNHSQTHSSLISGFDSPGIRLPFGNPTGRGRERKHVLIIDGTHRSWMAHLVCGI